MDNLRQKQDQMYDEITELVEQLETDIIDLKEFKTEMA